LERDRFDLVPDSFVSARFYRENRYPPRLREGMFFPIVLAPTDSTLSQEALAAKKKAGAGASLFDREVSSP
jgi:hypothetical protein